MINQEDYIIFNDIIFLKNNLASVIYFLQWKFGDFWAFLLLLIFMDQKGRKNKDCFLKCLPLGLAVLLCRFNMQLSQSNDLWPLKGGFIFLWLCVLSLSLCWCCYLLDLLVCHVFIWLMEAPQRVPKSAQASLQCPAGRWVLEMGDVIFLAAVNCEADSECLLGWIIGVS